MPVLAPEAGSEEAARTAPAKPEPQRQRTWQDETFPAVDDIDKTGTGKQNISSRLAAVNQICLCLPSEGAYFAF